jgi:6-phospho-3-hexuloisomerase
MEKRKAVDSDAALAEVAAAVRSVPDEALDAAAARIAGAGKIATYACGREGLVMKGLTMRLFHAGVGAHSVGEMTCPPISRGDLLIVSCGPGRISTVEAIVGVAKRSGASILCFTAQPGRAPASSADQVVVIEAQTMANDDGSTAILPMGSGFEIALFVLVDLITNRVRGLRSESREDMRDRHTNLE